MFEGHSRVAIATIHTLTFACLKVDETGTVTFLTTVEQEVTKILAYDKQRKLMYAWVVLF